MTGGELVKAIIDEMQKHYTLVNIKGHGIGMTDATTPENAKEVGEKWKELTGHNYLVDEKSRSIYLIKES